MFKLNEWFFFLVFFIIGICLNSIDFKDFKLVREIIGLIFKIIGIKDRWYYVIIFYLLFIKDWIRFFL